MNGVAIKLNVFRGFGGFGMFWMFLIQYHYHVMCFEIYLEPATIGSSLENLCFLFGAVEVFSSQNPS